MFLEIINFLQNALVVTSFILIITLMVRQDLKDEQRELQETAIETEEPKPITEVVYYEYMSPNEKFKKIVFELNKIEKLLPLEQKLIDFQECLTQVQQFKSKIDHMYKFENEQLINAIKWLEKPLGKRGMYEPLPYDKDKFESHNINDVEKAIRLTTMQTTNKSLEDVNPLTVHNKSIVTNMEDHVSDVNNLESVSEIPKSYKIEILNIPDINLENILETRKIIFNKLWPLGKFWYHKLFNDLMESTKIWYVVCMIIHRSIFNPKNVENIINTLSKFLNKLIIVQTEVNKEDDITTITLNILPKRTEKRKSGFYNFFYKLIAKVKSVF